MVELIESKIKRQEKQAYILTLLICILTKTYQNKNPLRIITNIAIQKETWTLWVLTTNMKG
jgi:predicted transposase YdaD